MERDQSRENTKACFRQVEVAGEQAGVQTICSQCLEDLVPRGAPGSGWLRPEGCRARTALGTA